MSSNPVPPREISAQELAQLVCRAGWDQAVLVCRREGDNGGEQVVNVGLTYRDGRIAEEMAKVIKQIMGWKPEGDFQNELDKEVAAAKAEMDEGPGDGTVSTGRKIIMPTIERKNEIDGKAVGGKRKRGN
jgi:hypothetical protein